MKILILAVTFAIVFVVSGAAQGAPGPAERLYNRLTSSATFKQNFTGEQFCWNTAGDLHDFLQQYKATGDTDWLDYGVKYYDAIIAKMAVGPDGYKGFIGPYIYNGKYWCDVHVGDAIIFGGILDFSYAVSRDPKLKEKYGAKASEYVEDAKKNVIEKWDARGTWHDYGAIGSYTAWTQYGQPNQYKDWAPMPAAENDTSPLNLPFNKEMDMAIVAMRIWQVTGEEKFKHRAEQIFGRFKSRIQLWNDCYHWNYWEPGGQWDLSNDPDHPFKHWINTHGERPYQEGEVANVVKAYNAGIVFTEADIKAILRTNLKVMWNQSLDHPLWANSNADLRQILNKPDSYRVPKFGVWGPTVWPALGQFDATIRTLSGGRSANRPPSYDRQDVTGNVEIPAVYSQFPMGSVRTIRMATVLPPIFASGQKAIITCKLMEPGGLQVALYSADGSAKLATLRQGEEKGGEDGRDGILVFPFDGNDPATAKPFPPGDYRVRWTVAGDGYREYPITIQPRQ